MMLLYKGTTITLLLHSGLFFCLCLQLSFFKRRGKNLTIYWHIMPVTMFYPAIFRVFRIKKDLMGLF